MDKLRHTVWVGVALAIASGCGSAEAGGTARADCSHTGAGGYCHFDVATEPDYAAALEGALAEIAGSLVRCDYELPPPPTGDVEFELDIDLIFTDGAGEMFRLLRSDEVDCDVGWRLSADGSLLTLCEASCLKVKAEPEGELEIVGGCLWGHLPA